MYRFNINWHNIWLSSLLFQNYFATGKITLLSVKEPTNDKEYDHPVWGRLYILYPHHIFTKWKLMSMVLKQHLNRSPRVNRISCPFQRPHIDINNHSYLQRRLMHETSQQWDKFDKLFSKWIFLFHSRYLACVCNYVYVYTWYDFMVHIIHNIAQISREIYLFNHSLEWCPNNKIWIRNIFIPLSPSLSLSLWIPDTCSCSLIHG